MEHAANLILNTVQAQGIYNAMLALSDVSQCDGLRLSFHGVVNGEMERIDVEETDVDVIRVSCRGGLTGKYREYHAGKFAFAAAYGLSLS